MTSSPLANIRLALRRWAVRLDVGVGLLAVTGLTALAARELSAILSGGGAATAETRGLASALIAAWVAVVLACLAGAVKITSTRQGLVTLFTSEIKAIQFGLARMQMFEFWHLLH